MINFAQPVALLGFALFIPVILLYLLKQRRRRLEVSTLLFWDKILRDEQTVTSLTRLKKLLSLLLQLLFIALLTLAAASAHSEISVISHGPMLLPTSRGVAGVGGT